MSNYFNLIQNSIGQMEGGEFQNLCDQYLFAKYHLKLSTPGMMDGTNKTTYGTPDSFVYRNDTGDYVIAMYGTRKHTFDKLVGDVNEAISKSRIAKENIGKIICCYGTGRISSKQDQQLRSITNPCELELISASTIAMDLLQNFRWIAVEYCGLPNGTNQVFSLESFVASHDKGKTNAPLTTHYVDNSDQLTKLKQSILNNNITVITGIPGMGKTRTVVEVLRQIENENIVQCLAVRSNRQNVFEDIQGYADSDLTTYCLLDDATSITGLEGILSLVTSEHFSQKIHFVLTVRKYLFAELRIHLQQFEYFSFPLSAPTKSEVTKIVEQYLPNKKRTSEKIIQLAHANPRACVLASILVNKKGPSVLTDSQPIIGAYYEAVLSESSIDKLQRNVLFVIAVFGRLTFVRNKKIVPLLTFFNMTSTEFEQGVEYLHEKEICTIVGDTVVGIEDQSIQDYIRYYYLFLTSSYSIERLFEQVYKFGFSTIVGLINGALTIAVNEEMKQRLKETCEVFYFNNLAQNNQVEFLKHFGNLMELEVINMVDRLIEETTKVESEINFDLNSFNNSCTHSDVIALLEVLCSTSIDNIDYILDSLFQYVNLDQTQVVPGYHLIINYLGIQANTSDPERVFCECVNNLAKINKIESPIVAELLFATCQHFLELHQDGFGQGDGITTPFWYFDYDDSTINQHVREQLWDVLNKIISSKLVPVESWQTIVHKTAFFSENCREIRLLDFKQMSRINQWYYTTEDREAAQLLFADIIRIEYMSHNYSLGQIKGALSKVQWTYWQLKGYSREYISSDEDVALDIDFDSRAPQDLATITLQLSNVSSLQNDFYPVWKNLESWLSLQTDSFRNKFCRKVFSYDNAGLGLVQVSIRQYSGRRFLKEYYEIFSDRLQQLYYAASLIQDPSEQEIQKMVDILESFSGKIEIVTSYAQLSSGYKSDTLIVNALIDMIGRTGNYISLKWIDEQSARQLVNNVENLVVFKQIYEKGLCSGIDEMNFIAAELKNDAAFINDLFTQLCEFESEMQIANDSIILNKLNACWGSAEFDTVLEKLLFDDKYQNDSLYRFQIQKIFDKANDNKCEWLLKRLISFGNDQRIVKVIIGIVNHYFSDSQAMPFFIQLDNSGLFFGRDLPVLRELRSWSGSEISIIDSDIKFVQQLIGKVKIAKNKAFLRQIMSELKQKEKEVAASEYLQHVG